MKYERLVQGGDSRTNWRTINELGLELERVGAALLAANRQIAEIRQRSAGSFSHPFQIYVYPESLRASPASTDWRTVRVRAGTVFIDWTEITPTGTDGVNPDDGDISTTGDIVCDATTAKHWLWLLLTASTASVENGATAPTWDDTHIPLGYVDTNTHAAEYRVTIRQLVRTDLFTFIC